MLDIVFFVPYYQGSAGRPWRSESKKSIHGKCSTWNNRRRGTWIREYQRIATDLSLSLGNTWLKFKPLRYRPLEAVKCQACSIFLLCLNPIIAVVDAVSWEMRTDSWSLVRIRLNMFELSPNASSFCDLKLIKSLSFWLTGAWNRQKYKESWQSWHLSPNWNLSTSGEKYVEDNSLYAIQRKISISYMSRYH